MNDKSAIQLALAFDLPTIDDLNSDLVTRGVHLLSEQDWIDPGFSFTWQLDPVGPTVIVTDATNWHRQLNLGSAVLYRFSKWGELKGRIMTFPMHFILKKYRSDEDKRWIYRRKWSFTPNIIAVMQYEHVLSHGESNAVTDIESYVLYYLFTRNGTPLLIWSSKPVSQVTGGPEVGSWFPLLNIDLIFISDTYAYDVLAVFRSDDPTIRVGEANYITFQHEIRQYLLSELVICAETGRDITPKSITSAWFPRPSFIPFSDVVPGKNAYDVKHFNSRAWDELTIDGDRAWFYKSWEQEIWCIEPSQPANSGVVVRTFTLPDVNDLLEQGLFCKPYFWGSDDDEPPSQETIEGGASYEGSVAACGNHLAVVASIDWPVTYYSIVVLKVGESTLTPIRFINFSREELGMCELKGLCGDQLFVNRGGSLVWVINISDLDFFVFVPRIPADEVF
jgi:hypothetical protein